MAGDFRLFQEVITSSMIYTWNPPFQGVTSASGMISPTFTLEQMEEIERNRVEQAFQEWLESRSF